MSQVERNYANLAKALQNNNGAECEKYPTIFFPEDSRWDIRDVDTRIAKSICAKCPIINECIIYAMTSHEPYGIWGGTTPAERKKRAKKS